MFDLIRPCSTCPFRKGQGERFQLHPERLAEILIAPAFQCHKTVDYSADDGKPNAGDAPQQCAGLMSLLHRAGCPNQIMQIGERLGGFFPDRLDHRTVYDSLRTALKAHTGKDISHDLDNVYAGISGEFPASLGHRAPSGLSLEGEDLATDSNEVAQDTAADRGR
jgi:hypothetical protein